MLGICAFSNEFEDLGVFRIAVLEEFESGGALVCLVSKIDFAGNSRIVLDDWFLYPSIQATLWKSVVGSSHFSINPESARALSVWPVLNADLRSLEAQVLGGFALSAEREALPSEGFVSEVDALATLATHYLSGQLGTVYESVETYQKTLGLAPGKLLDGISRFELAISTPGSVTGSLNRIENLRAGDSKDSATGRLLLRQLDRVLSSQKSPRPNREIPKHSEDDYFSGLHKLGLPFANVKADSRGQRSIREVEGKTARTLYFV